MANSDDILGLKSDATVFISQDCLAGLVFHYFYQLNLFIQSVMV